MSEKSIQQQLLEAPLPEERKKKLSSIFSGESLPSICYDVIAKHVFSPDLHPERMDFILQHTMKDPSFMVDKSASNEIYLQNFYSKKTITDIPAWLKDHRLADLGIQREAQEYIFNRADIYASNMLLLQYSVEAGQPKSEIDYANVDGSIIIVLMANSPELFRNHDSNRYIHRIIKARSDSGLEFPMIKQMAFVQLDKALELYLNDSYNEDEDIELLKLFAFIADINNDKVIKETVQNQLLDDIREDVISFTRDKEVQQMILAEDLAIMDWNSNMKLAHQKGHAEGHAEGIAEGAAEKHAEGLKALVQNLKPFLHDKEHVLEAIKKSEGFETTTLEMVEQYW